jgi:hypothetical protein
VALRNPLVPDLVHLAKCRHVRQPDDGLKDLRLVRTYLGEQLVDRGQNIARLRLDGLAFAYLTGEINRVA